jgi:RNA polymerase sigma factor (sigma-70 family)
MVLGVCRRVLRNVHDAEDAFQATFLVLARKGSTIRSRQVVASWLYGVAYRTAMKARAMNEKRRAKERHAGALPRSETSASGADEALLAQLDHELSRLPEKYRVPIILCELEGRSRKEAACRLGVPEGTLSWRLAQAKKMLARRLARHGVAFSAGAVAAALTEKTVLAGLSPALRASTLKTVLSAGAVPAKVLALTEGVIKAMLLTKLKITVCFAAVALAAGVGASGLTYRAAAQQPRQPAAQANRPQADELEALRLEFEAMRKLLQATRERVRVLENEVRTLKSGNRLPAGRMPGARPPAAPPPPVDPSGDLAPRPGAIGPGAGPLPAAPGQPAGPRPGPRPGNRTPPAAPDPFLSKPVQDADPLANVERAMNRLRANPKDTRAVEALERALKRLKEQEKKEKPDEPGEGTP